jgi:hypothetical protein
MGNIEKHIKSKLENRTFEFKDEYWEDALKLLEEQDRLKQAKTHSFWKKGFWGLLSLLFISWAVVGYLWMGNSSSDTNFVQDNSDVSKYESTLSPSAPNEKNKESNYGFPTKENRVLSTDENLNKSKMQEKSSASSVLNIEKGNPISSFKSIRPSKIIDEKSEEVFNRNDNSFLVNNNELHTNLTAENSILKKDGISNSSTFSLENVELPVIINEVDLIPSNIKPLEISANNIDLLQRSTSFSSVTIKPSTTKNNISVGILLGSQVQFDDPMGVGVAVGGYFRKNLIGNFSVRIEPQYRYVKVNNKSIINQSVTSYSFGRTDYQNKLYLTGLHEVHLPFLLSYDIKRYSFYGGMDFGWRFLTRNKLDVYENQALDSRERNLNLEGLSNVVTNSFVLGMDTKLTNRLKLGARFFYSPHGNYTVNSNEIVPEISSRPWSGQFLLTYNILGR